MAENDIGVSEARKIAELFDWKKARETLERERSLGVPLSEIWKRLGVTETVVSDGTDDR